MKLEQQVISLELAQKLKKLGAKQESVWIWGIGGDKCENEWTLLLSDDESWSAKEIYSAFTVAELGEILPMTVCTTKFDLGYRWQSHYELIKDDMSGEMEYIKHFASDAEANARAKMLIYLLENKLLTLL